MSATPSPARDGVCWRVTRNAMDSPLAWTRRPEEFPIEQQMLCRIAGRVWNRPPFTWPGLPLLWRVEPAWVGYFEDYGVRSAPNERVWFVVRSDPVTEGYGRVVDGEPLTMLDALVRARTYDTVGTSKPPMWRLPVGAVFSP
jgi:hypothetical protein